MKSLLPRSIAGLTFLLSCAPLTTLRADNLSRSSPFLGSGAGTVAAPITENSPLELRGIMSTSTGIAFGLFDPAKRQGGWVRLNEAGGDFTVRSYDASSDAVTVEYQGRMLTLALKTAKIATAAPVAMPPPMANAGLPRPNPMNVPPPAGLNPTPADEAKRLESVAAEVRRRRALRQQAAGQPGAPVPMVTPGTVQPVMQPGAQPPNATNPATAAGSRVLPGQTR